MMDILRELGGLLARHDESAPRQDTVEHNIATFKRIRGGLSMVGDHPMTFNPRREYWYSQPNTGSGNNRGVGQTYGYIIQQY